MNTFPLMLVLCDLDIDGDQVKMSQSVEPLVRWNQPGVWLARRLLRPSHKSLHGRQIFPHITAPHCDAAKPRRARGGERRGGEGGRLDKLALGSAEWRAVWVCFWSTLSSKWKLGMGGKRHCQMIKQSPLCLNTALFSQWNCISASRTNILSTNRLCAETRLRWEERRPQPWESPSPRY